MIGDVYPRRESHFAHKFVRLMLRVCAAQEIGIEAFVLLTAIVHTEDAKRYRAAVTYWNEQLQAILGCSRGRLVRAREKAVDHGWLHYESGTKGRAGKYWVTIPREYLDMEDTPIDHDPRDFTGDIPVQNGTESATIPVQNGTEYAKMPVQNGTASGRNPDGIRTESGRNPDGKRAPFYPSPNPNPKTPCSPPQGDDCLFDEFWKVVHRQEGIENAKRQWTRAVQRVLDRDCGELAEAASYIRDRMILFSRSPRASGLYSPSPSKWLAGGHYDDDSAVWQHAGTQEDDEERKRREAEAYRKRKNAELQEQFRRERALAESERSKSAENEQAKSEEQTTISR